MAQVAVYLDDALLRRLDRTARRRGTSRSRLVIESLRAHLDEELPESFFRALGSWDDTRSSKDIVGDIRKGTRSQARPGLR